VKIGCSSTGRGAIAGRYMDNLPFPSFHV